jgi:hypothetical protein
VAAYILAGAAVAGNSINACDRALQATLSHQDQVISTLEENPLKTINLNGNSPDLAGALVALSSFAPTVKSAQALVSADLVALRAAQESAQSASQSPLALAQRAALDQKVKRTGAAILGLLSAQRGLTAVDQAVSFLRALVVSLMDLEALAISLNKNDVAGAAALVSRLQQELATTVSSGQQADLPPQLGQLTQGLSALVVDTGNVINALQAHDASGYDRSVAKMQTDLTATSAFDEAGANSWMDTLSGQLRDEYNAQMKVAQGQ